MIRPWKESYTPRRVSQVPSNGVDSIGRCNTTDVNLLCGGGVDMRPGKRFGLSAIEKCDVWRRWKAGESLHDIGRAFGKEHSCICSVLLPRGGIAPLTRRPSRLALNLAERQDISRGIASGLSIREIARGSNRAASTVSREVTRHGGRSAYRAQDPIRQAWISALRPKRCLLATNRRLRNIVASKLVLDWSPEQISGWLKNRYPDDPSMRVSHAIRLPSAQNKGPLTLPSDFHLLLMSRKSVRLTSAHTSQAKSSCMSMSGISMPPRMKKCLSSITH